MIVQIMWPACLVMLIYSTSAARLDSNTGKTRTERTALDQNEYYSERPVEEIRPPYLPRYSNNNRGSTKYQVPSYLTAENSARSISESDHRSSDGTFSFEYQTDNGIKVKQESFGYGSGKVVRGYYSYIGPDGIKYTTNYIADKNGYRAFGAHLPTQPYADYETVQFPQEPPLPPLFVQKPKPAIVQRPPFISSTPAPQPLQESQQVIYYPVQQPQQFYVTRPSYIHVTPKPQYFIGNWDTTQ